MSVPAESRGHPGPAPADRIASVAEAMSDPRRVRALDLLRRTPATVSEVSAELGLRPAATSLLLARLRRAGLVRVQSRGRHRIYSGDPEALGRLLEVLERTSSNVRSERRRSEPASPRRPAPGSDLQVARTCYDHLAGSAGVALARAIEERGWVTPGPPDYLLTPRGEQELTRRGVDVSSCREARRRLVYGCLDWTERRPHLGGSLGAALLRSLELSGYLTVGPGRRVNVRRPLDGFLRR